MYIKFATEEDICKALAKYKIGDHVVTLKDIRTANGMIEANTELQITEVCVPKDVFLPLDIPHSQLMKCVAPYDEYTFIYKLIPLDHYYNGTIFELDSSNFEYADQAMADTYTTKRKNKKKAVAIHRNKIFLPVIGSTLLLTLIIFWFIGMPMVASSVNSIYRMLWSFLISGMTAGVAIMMIAVFCYLFLGDKYENRFRKYAFGHLIRKED